MGATTTHRCLSPSGTRSIGAPVRRVTLRSPYAIIFVTFRRPILSPRSGRSICSPAWRPDGSRAERGVKAAPHRISGRVEAGGRCSGHGGRKRECERACRGERSRRWQAPSLSRFSLRPNSQRSANGLSIRRHIFRSAPLKGRVGYG